VPRELREQLNGLALIPNQKSLRELFVSLLPLLSSCEFRGARLCAAHLTHFPNFRVISGLAEVFPAQIVAAGAVKCAHVQQRDLCARETDAHVCSSSTQHSHTHARFTLNGLFIHGLLIICAAASRARKPNAWAKTSSGSCRKGWRKYRQSFLFPARVCRNNFDNAKSASISAYR
jgi:hypothetical protein